VTDEIGIAGFDLDRPGRWAITVAHVGHRASLVVNIGNGR
jgi:hypothetical protein